MHPVTNISRGSKAVVRLLVPAVVVIASFVTVGAVSAGEKDWLPVIVYNDSAAGEPGPQAGPQAAVPFPMPGQTVEAPSTSAMGQTRPVLMRPGAQSIPPWPRPLPEDFQEQQLLKAQGAVRAQGGSRLTTGSGAEAPPAAAAGAKVAAPPQPQPAGAQRPRREAPPEEALPGQQYCFNIADAAADARFAWQQRTLAEIEQELEKRVALLEQKTKEYKSWLARREEFANKAQDGLVKIYTRMRADAAATQIAAMDEETAAALMAKLDPRTASAVMAEMDPQQAARLSAVIAGAARTGDSREQAAANAKALQSEQKQ